MTAEEIANLVTKFQGLLGQGNGQMVIHFAGGIPQKVRVDMDASAVLAASDRKVRIAR